MIYSYTQLSHYLACPQRYRYRYLEGWQEKEVRANLVFGRAFENALGAYFRREDASGTFFQQWSQYRDAELEYSTGDSWDKLLQGGFKLLDRFAQEDRVRIRRPRKNLQLKLVKPLSANNAFVSYVDAIGKLDGKRSIIDWKTTTSCYPENTEQLLSLDPQLLCYSWMTGEPNVAFVVFVRKRMPEIQYLRATISEDQRRQFGELVTSTVAQIESGNFLPHSGIRFPNNGCTSCAHLGLCLANQSLIGAKLTRPEGNKLDWLDELAA
jgi:PD-(D/E)XK nuclease superfamily